jgi:predicted  nucleic acid-binding Zn-ribbon protein
MKDSYFQTRVEEEINGIQEFISQKKQSMKDSEELIKKYEKQSENVKNSREFEAINKEIEMQQLEGKLAEKHIRDANEELAEKAKLLEQTKKEKTQKLIEHKKNQFIDSSNENHHEIHHKTDPIDHPYAVYLYWKEQKKE